MARRDYTDILGGLIILAVGVFVVVNVWLTMPIGTLRRMGPGLFPLSLGVLLAVFGLVLVIPALFRKGVVPEVRFWTPLFVFLGIAAFAISLRPLGLIPAIVLLTVISSLAELRVHPVGLTLMCAGLSLFCWLLFGVAMGMNIPMARWPF